MSYVDQPERQPRSFSERWQDVWDHPTPFGLIGYIKALTEAARSIPSMVDSAATLAGPPPSTEEEAYRYNQARNYLPGASFEVGSALTPTAPKAVGRIAIRPLGRDISRRPPGSANNLAPVEAADAAVRFPRTELPGGPPRVDYGPLQFEHVEATSPAVLRYGGAEQRAVAPTAGLTPRGGATPPDLLTLVEAPSIVPGPQSGRFGTVSEQFGGQNRSEPSHRLLHQDRLPRVAEQLENYDPDFRVLRVSPLAGETGQPDTSKQLLPLEEDPPENPNIPLLYDNLDIPDFLRRQAEPAPTNSEAKARATDAPPTMIGGGTGGIGGRGGGGGGGDGRKSEEECREEREKFHKICVDAFENGTIGDVMKRWKSNYPTGPFPKRSTRP
jgi:hypothetical protein